jgi:iron complex outermembrane receptor protein
LKILLTDNHVGKRCVKYLREATMIKRTISKRLSTVFLAGVTSSALIATMPVMAQESGAEDDVTSRDAGAGGEIVVTAQRRAQSLERTPIAVSALGGADLATRQITGTRDLVTNVPNLTGNSNVGQSTAVAFFIRGVGTTENLATADPSVGVYIDDVYVGRQAVNNFGLFDIERIEVLRGPQGTLYGRNCSPSAPMAQN